MQDTPEAQKQFANEGAEATADELRPSSASSSRRKPPNGDAW